jgi:hypothetical protein
MAAVVLCKQYYALISILMTKFSGILRVNVVCWSEAASPDIRDGRS